MYKTLNYKANRVWAPDFSSCNTPMALSALAAGGTQPHTCMTFLGWQKGPRPTHNSSTSAANVIRLIEMLLLLQ